MLGFSAFKRKPRQFNYTPRHYDPQQEEREARQRALGIIEDEKYVPGSYIRSNRMRRMLGQDETVKSDNKRVVFIRFLIAVLLLVGAAYLIITSKGLEAMVLMMQGQ